MVKQLHYFANLQKEIEKVEIDDKKEIDSVIDDTEPKSEFEDIEIIEKPSSDEREWAIFVYMSADNNLESAAIADLLEMEKSKLNTNNVTVLVLLDRNPSYDSSNGNWHNTKLYRVKTNNISNTNEILSEEKTDHRPKCNNGIPWRRSEQSRA